MKATQADRRQRQSIMALVALAALIDGTLTQSAAAAAKPAHRSGGGSIYLTTPNPTNPLEHNNRGVELGMKGLWPQAIQEGQMALDGDPENETFQRNLSGAHLRYADSLANKKSYVEAIKQYRDALFVDPANGPAEGSLNTCLQHLSGKDPRDPSYRSGLASGFEGHGDYRSASVEYRVCTHIQDSGPNNYKLGRALLRANKTVDGFDALRTALRKDWSRDEQDMLAECHILLGDTLLNFAYIAKKQGRMPDYFRRLNNSMVEYRRAAAVNGNMAAVHGLTETAREAVAIQPSFGNLLALGSAYLLQLDFDHAKVYFEKAWRANPSSPELARARLAFHRKVVESPQGIVSPMRIAESVQKVEDLLKTSPNDPDLLYILGKGRAKIGDTGGAISALQQSLSIRKFDENTQRELDRLTGRGGDQPATAQSGALGGPPGTPNIGGAPGTPGVTAAPGTPGAAGTPGTGAPGAPPQNAAPQNAAAYAQIESMTSGGQLDQAAAAADAVLNATPADGRAWYLKGVVMEKKADLDEAAVCYRQASGLKVKEADDALARISAARTKPLVDQADALIAKGDLPGAASLLREASSMAPKDAALWRKFGDILKKTGDEEGATKAYKRADDAAKGK